MCYISAYFRVEAASGEDSNSVDDTDYKKSSSSLHSKHSSCHVTSLGTAATRCQGKTIPSSCHLSEREASPVQEERGAQDSRNFARGHNARLTLPSFYRFKTWCQKTQNRNSDNRKSSSADLVLEGRNDISSSNYDVNFNKQFSDSEFLRDFSKGPNRNDNSITDSIGKCNGGKLSTAVISDEAQAAVSGNCRQSNECVIWPSSSSNKMATSLLSDCRDFESRTRSSPVVRPVSDPDQLSYGSLGRRLLDRVAKISSGNATSEAEMSENTVNGTVISNPHAATYNAYLMQNANRIGRSSVNNSLSSSGDDLISNAEQLPGDHNHMRYSNQKARPTASSPFLKRRTSAPTTVNPLGDKEQVLLEILDLQNISIDSCPFRTPSRGRLDSTASSHKFRSLPRRRGVFGDNGGGAQGWSTIDLSSRMKMPPFTSQFGDKYLQASQHSILTTNVSPSSTAEPNSEYIERFIIIIILIYLYHRHVSRYSGPVFSVVVGPYIITIHH